MPEAKHPTTCILIPCHNEELSIRECVRSCLSQSEPADHIVVVNDGSTDRSGEYLREFGERITVVTLPFPTGNKSYAQQHGLRHIDEDIFFVTDGDTILDKDFVKEMKGSFKDERVGAVAGYVKSLPYNFFTAFREYEYYMGQNIHKRAQSHIGFLMIVPGCSGGFRTEIFKREIGFDHDTLAEDIDFTYKMHRAGKKIIFNERAIAYTQDPHTLTDYMNQMRRWYAGGWQNLRKHLVIAENPRGAFELSLTYIEGLLATALFFVVPFINVIFFAKLVVACIGLMLLLGLFVSVRRRRVDIFVYSPLFVLIIYLNAYLFLEQFIMQILLGRRNLYWFRPSRRAI